MHRLMDQNREPRNRPTQISQLISDKGQKTMQGKKGSLSTNGVGMRQKEKKKSELQPKSHTLYKN